MRRTGTLASAVPVMVLLLVFITLPTEKAAAGPSQEGVIYTEPKDLGRPNRLAVIEVDGWGTIKFELYENMTPITTKNFIDLAQSGFYDGIKFHRCIDDFVAQTGDPNTRNNNPYDDGMGGSDTTIPLEICQNASHVDGAVGMARSSEPDTASSQFYICDGPQHQLDDWNRDGNGYAVFGVVVEGLEIGDVVVVRGHASLVDGAVVALRRPDGSPDEAPVLGMSGRPGIPE